jgi:replicative DNA helicase
MGKSTLAFQISRNISESGLSVLYFSNEMTSQQLWIKATCGATELNWRDIKRDGATEAQKEKLLLASSELIERYGESFRIDDRVDHGVATIWQACRKYKPSFVVVDVLQNLTDKGDNEVRRIGEIIKGLKFIAKDTNSHIFALTHVNRSVEANKGKIPTMAQLRESGHLENTADNVILLYSKNYYENAVEQENRFLETDVIIAKSRDGVRNVKIVLQYDLLQQWFGDAVREVQDYTR